MWYNPIEDDFYFNIRASKKGKDDPQFLEMPRGISYVYPINIRVKLCQCQGMPTNFHIVGG
jgi:hypothetical protein